MNLQIHAKQDDAVYEELVAGVRAHNLENMGTERSQPLMVTARDDSGTLIGGVAGRTIYRNFLIDVLWVAAELRGSGLGSRLMAAAEEEARSRGCAAAQVDTLSFQAPSFYARLGFEVAGRIEAFPGSPERIFFRKGYDPA